MKIDNSRETSKNTVLDNFTIEAALFDSGSWYSIGGSADLLSSNVANLKLDLSPGSILGFRDYLLVGRLEAPRLWSAEQVGRSFHYYLLLSSYFILK